MRFNVGFRTDIGRRRPQNQDNGAVFPDLGLFLVADGMGGHRGGETASSTAVKAIESKVRICQEEPNWNPEQTLIKSFDEANHAIYERSMLETQLQGMGTTTTALLFKDNTLTIGHVGDSRCYFIRPCGIWQATRDHSLVQEKLRAGLISRKDLKTDRMKNVITRSVGFERAVNVEIYHMQVQTGDSFMLCSDGLTGMIDDCEIFEIAQKFLFESTDQAQKLTEELVSAANHRGGEDNITSIIVQVS